MSTKISELPSGQVINPVTYKAFTANSGSTITLDFDNGNFQEITLTANTTITLPTATSSGKQKEINLYLKQDGTGGKSVAFVNASYASPNGTPSIAQAAGALTYLGIVNDPVQGCTIFTPFQNLGITSGSNPGAGQIGEVISSTVAVGSAVALTDNVNNDITHIDLTAGNWQIITSFMFTGTNANLSGLDNSYVFIGTAAGDNTTGRDLAKNTTYVSPVSNLGFSLNIYLSASPLNWYQSISSPASYYLKAFTDQFSTGISGFGTIIAIRVS